jgi:hypothetical protein
MVAAKTHTKTKQRPAQTKQQSDHHHHDADLPKYSTVYPCMGLGSILLFRIRLVVAHDDGETNRCCRRYYSRSQL